MSDVAIRQAFEKRLEAMGAFDTAYENVNFAPTPDVPYQKVNLLPATPQNPTFDGFKRFIGLFQVTLFYPQGVGPAVAAARAEAIRAQFPRKLSLVQSGITVIIDGTPEIMAGFEDGDRWAVPIRIPYFANVS